METENERWHRIMSEPTPRVERQQRKRKTPSLRELREAQRAAVEDIHSFARIAFPGLLIGWLVLGVWLLIQSR